MAKIVSKKRDTRSVRKLKDSVESLKMVNEILRGDIERYKTQRSLKEELFDKTNTAAGILMEKNRELNKSLAVATNKLSELSGEKSELETRLAETKERLDWFEKKALETHVQLKELDKELNHLRNQRDDLQATNTTLLFRNRELDSKVIDCLHDIEVNKAANKEILGAIKPDHLLSNIQKQVIEWNKRNFGEHFPIPVINMIESFLGHGLFHEHGVPSDQQRLIDELKRSVGYRYLLGMMEELGEVTHVHLKREQHIREGLDPEKCDELIKDGIGDLLNYAICYCESQGTDLISCLQHAWKQIKDRDWTQEKKQGYVINERDVERYKTHRSKFPMEL